MWSWEDSRLTDTLTCLLNGWEKQVQHHLNQGNVCRWGVYMSGGNHLKIFKHRWQLLKLKKKSWHQKLPNHRWTLWYHFRDTIGYHSNIMTCKKTPLTSDLGAYISKTAGWNFFLISNFDKQDKMQLKAKFKKIILYMGFRGTLNFRKVKVALSPMYRMFSNFA